MARTFVMGIYHNQSEVKLITYTFKYTFMCLNLVLLSNYQIVLFEISLYIYLFHCLYYCITYIIYCKMSGNFNPSKIQFIAFVVDSKCY